MTPVSFPTGKWAFIFFSDDSGEPGYLAVKRLILCTFLGLTSVLKALFSRSGLIAWLDEESSGRRRISSIREQAFRSSANKVANMKMNRRLSSMIFRNIETANRSEALKSAIFELSCLKNLILNKHQPTTLDARLNWVVFETLTLKNKLKWLLQWDILSLISKSSRRNHKNIISVCAFLFLLFYSASIFEERILPKHTFW